MSESKSALLKVSLVLQKERDEARDYAAELYRKLIETGADVPGPLPVWLVLRVF